MKTVQILMCLTMSYILKGSSKMEQRIVIRQFKGISLSIVFYWSTETFEFRVESYGEGFSFDEDEFRFAIEKFAELVAKG